MLAGEPYDFRDPQLCAARRVRRRQPVPRGAPAGPARGMRRAAEG
ncbi:maltose acetyltransferase domain-containing protein [Sorangium sp. So ce1504]